MILGSQARSLLPQARRIVLMAFGENKAGVVHEAVEGPVTEKVRRWFFADCDAGRGQCGRRTGTGGCDEAAGWLASVRTLFAQCANLHL